VKNRVSKFALLSIQLLYRYTMALLLQSAPREACRAAVRGWFEKHGLVGLYKLNAADP
jgi:hypothetical protein